jgi:hypothetical protein
MEMNRDFCLFVVLFLLFYVEELFLQFFLF